MVEKERDRQTPRADASSLLSARNGSPKPHRSTDNRRQSPSDQPLERVSRAQEGRKRQFVCGMWSEGEKKNVPEVNAGMLCRAKREQDLCGNKFFVGLRTLLENGGDRSSGT